MRYTRAFFAMVLLVPLAVLQAADAPKVSGVPPQGEPPVHRPPNVVIILADDLGFSDVGCYGGEIHTPNIDALAAGGLRFTQFYNTARCWPTRACMLSGYYPQMIRMDPIKGRLPKWTRLLPHYLKPAGYRCYHSGKWHVMGAPKSISDAGFDHSYRVEDHDRHFYPKEHTEDDQPLPPIQPGSDYYTTTAYTDHAIRCLKEHAEKYPDKPFFTYLAFTSPHFPLQAPAQDVAKYKDRYLVGWDVIRQERWERLKGMGIVTCELSPRDPTFKPRYFNPRFMTSWGPGEVDRAVAWTELSEEQKQFQATKMSIHAAMVDRIDQEVGRLVEQLKAMGAFENTVIFFLSDNGADATLLIRGDGHDPKTAPGSGGSYLCIGPGWATASNTPFKWHKVWTYEGGVSTPLIAHWPKGIASRGELRQSMGHVIDIVPTILELAGAHPAAKWNGVEAPKLPGKSLVPLLDKDGTVDHEFIYFNHEGNRGLREGDWKLVSASEHGDVWELYNLASDREEIANLAAQQPERVSRMRERWEALTAEYGRWAQTP